MEYVLYLRASTPRQGLSGLGLEGQHLIAHRFLQPGDRILSEYIKGSGRKNNRSEMARAVFHGKNGEMRQRYREGMEEQLGALELVVTALVLWNTHYLQQALEQWQQTEGGRGRRGSEPLALAA
jgi:hypothetical protein